MTDDLRPDLAAVFAARAGTRDENRPDAVARQHAKGRLMPLERFARLLDKGSFVEYGQLLKPKGRGMEGPGDAVRCGHGTIGGQTVCVASYDYTVFGGSQTQRNHRKLGRTFELAQSQRWPVVLWAEGGGARPMMSGQANADSEKNRDFAAFARCSGQGPTVAVVPGHSFAGHAIFVSTAECVVATRDATMGIAAGGMLAAATGEKLRPEEIGPAELHEKTGSIDILVENEEEAIARVAHFLSFFRGRVGPGEEPDTQKLRTVMPESNRRAYDVRQVVRHIVDVGSMLELRPNWARATVTAFGHIAGFPVGIVANQPMYLSGAINAESADKIARFVQLCDAYDIPLVMLCDTPGFLAGRASEEMGTVRHSGRALLALAHVTVPILTVVLRKAYGAGYVVMGSDLLDPVLLVAWPSAEFGGMGIEGAVNMMFAKELAEAPDEATRMRIRNEKAAEIKARFTGLNNAKGAIIDDVIDPAETRSVLLATLSALTPPPERVGKKRYVDAF